MKRLVLSLVVIGFLFSGAQAGEYLINKMKYFPSLQASCDIKVYKSLTMDIDVVCGSKGGGNCSGHTTDGYFACNTFSGNSKGINGVNNAINWILNNL